MDSETLNRFYYQNELVLRVSPEAAKTKASTETVRVKLSVPWVHGTPATCENPRLVWLCKAR